MWRREGKKEKRGPKALLSKRQVEISPTSSVKASSVHSAIYAVVTLIIALIYAYIDQLWQQKAWINEIAKEKLSYHATFDSLA